MDELETRIPEVLDDVQLLYTIKLSEMRNAKTFTAVNMDEMEKILNETPGFVKAMYCGNEECEITIKDRMAATARCIPFEQGRSQINVYAAKKKPNIWFTGEEHINCPHCHKRCVYKFSGCRLLRFSTLFPTSCF